MSWDALESHSDRLLGHVMNDPYFADILPVRQRVVGTRYQIDMDVSNLFPTDKEREILTNGIASIPLSSAETEYEQHVEWAWNKEHEDESGRISSSERIEYLFDKYAEIKATAPDRPVYLMHNHPALGKNALDNPDTADAQFVQHHHFDQESDYDTIGSIPSNSDIGHWSTLRSLVTPAIYHQQDNVAAAYMENADVAHSTHIVLEHVAASFSPVLGDMPEVYRVRLAAEGDEGDESKGDVVVPFEEWPKAKEKYGDKLSYIYLMKTN